MAALDQKVVARIVVESVLPFQRVYSEFVFQHFCLDGGLLFRVADLETLPLLTPTQ